MALATVPVHARLRLRAMGIRDQPIGSADRGDPARVCGSHHRLGGDALAPNPAFLRLLRQRH
jgi:hypothetical protein